MNAPSQIIIFLCIAAIIALIVNKWRKLPKFIFLFFAIAIVVSVCWLTFEKEGLPQEKTKEVEEAKAQVIFVESAKSVLFTEGKTKINLHLVVSGKRKFDCVRFILNAKDLNTTEQGFVDKVKFSLILNDGTSIPASGIFFEQYDENSSFPEKFILKIFFLPKSGINYDEVRCVVENNFTQTFSASEISFGSLPDTDQAE